MSDWIEAAEQAATRLGYEASSEAWAFLDGARWMREALLTPETVERGARALDENFNPDKYPIMAAMFRDYAKTALTAAIGGDDE